MKKISTVITLTACAVIVFFRIFGDAIYHAITPDVEVYTVSAAALSDDGKARLILPRECLRDGRALVLEPVPAFERTAFILKSVEVTVADNTDGYYGDAYLIDAGLRRGDVAAIMTNGMEEGDRVEMGRSLAR